MARAQPHVVGAAYAVAAAGLYGAAAPFEKRILEAGAGPVETAGLLYAGAALFLALAYAARRGRAPDRSLRGSDLMYLAGAVLLGGLVGPVLKLVGLGEIEGVTASLLLNLETPATIAIAVAFFGETVGRRMIGGAALVVGGGVVLGLEPGRNAASLVGVLAVAGSSVAWAMDNNLTARISDRDAIAIAFVKCAVAAPLMLAIAALLGGRPIWQSDWPAARLAAAFLVGAGGYGLSLACFVRALRAIGAARTGTLFASAPFVGAILSVPILGEKPSAATMIAGALMVAGIAAIVGERR